MSDATDRGRREATHRHLCVLAADLNQDELDVAIEVVDGLKRGRGPYGPLVIADDRRDFDAEMQDELRDFVVYRAIAKLKRQREQRVAIVEAAARELHGDGDGSVPTPIDAWGKVIVRSRHARPNPPAPPTPGMLVEYDPPLIATAAVNAEPGAYQLVCDCAECWAVRAELGYATAPAPEPVEPERSTAINVATDEESGDGW